MCAPITWERVCGIFGNPPPAWSIKETQFEGNRERLRDLARTPVQKINFADLGCYYEDLAYVELQPEIFRHLFPACLMHWQQTLRQGLSCEVDNVDFHYGVDRGDVFNKMLSPQERLEVFAVFHDGLILEIDRLETPREFGRETFGDLNWLFRFNSLAMVLPQIEPIWNSWWRTNTLGRALAVVQFCSLLTLQPREFDYQGPPIPPDVWEDDTNIYEHRWLPANVGFLKRTLTAEYAFKAINEAQKKFPEEETFDNVVEACHQLLNAPAIMEMRIEQLPEILQNPKRQNFRL